MPETMNLLEFAAKGGIDIPEERLRRRLLELELSDHDIATLLGITRQNITKWRNSRNLPPPRGSGAPKNTPEERHARREKLRIAAQLLEDAPHR